MTQNEMCIQIILIFFSFIFISVFQCISIWNALIYANRKKAASAIFFGKFCTLNEKFVEWEFFGH